LRQLELIYTHVFARPAAARAWFERLLVDSLTLRPVPDHVAIVFAPKVIPPPPAASGRALSAAATISIQVHMQALEG
jgi:hypothetical protein